MTKRTVNIIVNSLNYFDCSEVGNQSDPFKMRVVFLLQFPFHVGMTCERVAWPWP